MDTNWLIISEEKQAAIYVNAGYGVTRKRVEKLNGPKIVCVYVCVCVCGSGEQFTLDAARSTAAAVAVVLFRDQAVRVGNSKNPIHYVQPKHL